VAGGWLSKNLTSNFFQQTSQGLSQNWYLIALFLRGPFTIEANQPASDPSFFAGNASATLGGAVNLSFSFASPGVGTFTESVTGSTPLTATFELSDISFPTVPVPEANQLALNLVNAVIGATVLFRFRRSATA